MKQKEFEEIDKILRANGRPDLATKLCTFANQVADVLTAINNKLDGDAEQEEHSITVYGARGANYRSAEEAKAAWDRDEAFVVDSGDNRGQIFSRSNIATLMGKLVTDVIIGTSSGKFLVRVKV